MTDAERRAAAKQFAADWKDRGDEKQILCDSFAVLKIEKTIDSFMLQM